MTFDQHGNFGYGTVAVPPSPPASGTTFQLTAGQAARFAAPPYNAVVWPGTAPFPLASNAEIVRVTGASGDVLTITRQQEGSLPRTILAGDQFAAAITAKVVTDVEGAISAETTRAEAAEALLAPLVSPSLTGNPTVPTQAPGTNSTRVASTAYADAAVSVETSRATTAEALRAQGLVPTAVKTGPYTAAAADFVPVDVSAGSVTVTLPTAPADKTRIGVKPIAVSGSNTVTIARGGSDVFNKAGGSTSLTLAALFQGLLLQYAASSGIWYVQSFDSPIGVANGAASLDGTTRVPAAQMPASVVTGASLPVGAGARPEPAIRPLKRDVLILDNNANGNGATNSTQILAEQFIPDLTTGAMYLLYYGNGSGTSGVCLAKASGTPTNPAVPDPTVNAFTDRGPLKASGSNIGGDSAHLVIANNTYFLFSAHNTATGSEIYCYTAPQITSGAIVPLESAVWANAVVACYPGAGIPGSFAAAQGGAGSLPNSLQTLQITALDHDGLEGGVVTTTITPTASSAVTLTWTAPPTGETNGYNIYRNGQFIATVAHATLTYSVTGAEALGAAVPGWTASSCARLDEPFVSYNTNSGYWEMLAMGFNAAGSMEQIHLARLGSSGIAALAVGATSFVKQNKAQPVVPAGNYAAVFGTTIPGGASMATLHDYEVAADPFAFQMGKYTIVGYSAGAQGAIASTNRYRIALAVTTDTSDPMKYTKLGVMHHPSAAMNFADAGMGAAVDGRGQNRACCASWRGAMYVDALGVGHMARCAKLANGSDHTQAYYYKYDLSGLPDVINGIRNLDPWVRVEAESTDTRLTRSGFASLSTTQPYFSGGGIGGSGGKCRDSTVVGETLTFTFLGSAVRVLIGRISTTGSVDILLDGGGTEGISQFSAIDLTSDVAGTWTTVFAAQWDNLPPGVHQIMVRTVTTGASGIFVDAFDYIPLPGLAA